MFPAASGLGYPGLEAFNLLQGGLRMSQGCGGYDLNQVAFVGAAQQVQGFMCPVTQQLGFGSQHLGLGAQPLGGMQFGSNGLLCAQLPDGQLPGCQLPGGQLPGGLLGGHSQGGQLHNGHLQGGQPMPLGSCGPPEFSERSGSATKAEIDQFVLDNRLDESAGRILRAESIEVQTIVLERGSLSATANPSSAVMGRIREAKRRALASGSAASGGGGQMRFAESDALAAEVDQFIAENRLDEGAAKIFRNEVPEVQRRIVDRGSLAECSNPSSAVMGRIRDAKSSLKAQPRDAGQGVFGQAMHPNVAMERMELSGLSADDVRDKVEAFVEENRIDEQASHLLRLEPPESQLSILNRGGLADCANPSSAVMGRIRDAKAQRKVMNQMPGSGLAQRSSAFQQQMASHSLRQREELTGAALTELMDKVESFIADNGLDAKSSATLRGEAPEVMQVVIDRGGLSDCLNPSSAVVGRIRDTRAQIRASTPRGGVDPLGPHRRLHGTAPDGQGSLEQFIADNHLDDTAANALRGEHPDVQLAIMARGGLQECANPSSAVMGRMRDIKAANRSERSERRGEQMRERDGNHAGCHAGGQQLGALPFLSGGYVQQSLPQSRYYPY